MVEYSKQEHKNKNYLQDSKKGVNEYQRHPETTRMWSQCLAFSWLQQNTKGKLFAKREIKLEYIKNK